MAEDVRQLMAEVDEALTRRVAEWPQRGAGFADFSERVDRLFAALWAETAGAFPVADGIRDLVMRPVFICGWMKSGTSLLVQLLDNHPALLVLPGDTHLANRREEFESGSVTDFARFWFQRLVNPTGQLPCWFLGRDAGRLLQFLSVLRHYLEGGVFPQRMQALVAALVAVGVSPGARRWVEKTPANERHLDLLRQLYPHALFLHVVRHPLENAVSLHKLSQVRGWGLSMTNIGEGLAFSLTAALREKGAGYHVLRYEDLLLDSQTVMAAVAQFLSIDYATTLLIPTQAGEEASANSMHEGGRVRGKINRDNGEAGHFRRGLTEEDAREVAGLTVRPARRLGYGFPWRLWWRGWLGIGRG